MKYEIVKTTKFKKDYKLVKKQNKNLESLKSIIKMLADDIGNLLLGQLLAETEDFCHGNEDVKDKRQQEQGDVGVEKHAADGGAEIGKVFEHRVDDEHKQGDEHKEDSTPQ